MVSILLNMTNLQCEIFLVNDQHKIGFIFNVSTRFELICSESRVIKFRVHLCAGARAVTRVSRGDTRAWGGDGAHALRSELRPHCACAGPGSSAPHRKEPAAGSVSAAPGSLAPGLPGLTPERQAAGASAGETSASSAKVARL